MYDYSFFFFLLFKELHDKLTPLESIHNGYLLVNSREFLLGQSYVSTGETGKAIECFIKASGGIENGMKLV